MDATLRCYGHPSGQIKCTTSYACPRRAGSKTQSSRDGKDEISYRDSRIEREKMIWLKGRALGGRFFSYLFLLSSCCSLTAHGAVSCVVIIPAYIVSLRRADYYGLNLRPKVANNSAKPSAPPFRLQCPSILEASLQMKPLTPLPSLQCSRCTLLLSCIPVQCALGARILSWFAVDVVPSRFPIALCFCFASPTVMPLVWRS